MITVNLLRSRAVSNADPAAVASGAAPAAVAVEGIESFQLDSGFNTFEYSQAGQILKIVLLIAFVAPLIFFEKMRGDEGQAVISSRSSELQSIQDIKF